MTAGTITAQGAAPVRRQLFGLPFDAVTMGQALGICMDAVNQRRYLPVAVVNAAKVMTMRRDSGLRDAVASCRLILADGQSVVWASRVLGAPLPERVAGIDLFQELLAASADRGCRVYFLGARADVLSRMLARVEWRFPGLSVAGARDGYYSSGEEALIAAEIRRSGADMLFLGMSSPRKELFQRAYGEATGAPVVHGVGGSFDVLAGVTKRAPQWYQRHGLEWFYRAKQEPIRLGRRYLTTNASFIALVAAQAMRLPGSSPPAAMVPGQLGVAGRKAGKPGPGRHAAPRGSR
jgi:N-acetylglucosaminyldiphosphoundecaprenol N-acetyl-beta-D-mannosaminyltransferase